jgi:rfaE bifunctional protein kinase chain/domain
LWKVDAVPVTQFRPVSGNLHPERLLELLELLRGQPVLILADLVADQFVMGVPKRISREAPVLILREAGTILCPGGGANAAANVAALGGVPLVVGLVGADASGQALLSNLASRGIETDAIVTEGDWTTPTKTRILAGFPTGSRQQVVRIDREPAGELSPKVRAEIERRLGRFDGRARVAIASDYGYGVAHPELLGTLRSVLAKNSVRHVLVDSRFRLLEFRGASGATPNLEEAEAAVARPLALDPVAFNEGGRWLQRELGLEFLLITRGSQGMSLFLEDAVAHLPVFGTDQVADVTGAGDTVIGTLALALAAGASPLEAAVLANLAGGLVVMKLGTATVSAAELAQGVASLAPWLEGIRWERY